MEIPRPDQAHFRDESSARKRRLSPEGVRRVILTNPMEARLELGAELRRLRTARGLTMKAVATFLECSEPRISRLETGKLEGAVLKEEELRRLARHLGVKDRAQIDDLVKLLRAGTQSAWWEGYEDVLPTGLDTLVGLQTSATRERAFEPLLINGLLQTPEYARMILAEPGLYGGEDIERLIQLRVDRTQLLHRDPPLELEVVVDEAALRRPIGGRDLMRAQLMHLHQMAQAPNITVRVIPLTAGAHAGLGGAFSLVETGTQDPVVYVDSPAGNLFLHKQRDVQRFTARYKRILAKSLEPHPSLALISSAAEEML